MNSEGSQATQQNATTVEIPTADLEQQIDALQKQVRERDPARMEQRFQEALQALTRIAAAENPTTTHNPIKERIQRLLNRETTKKNNESSFPQRVQTFLDFVDNELFTKIYHRSNSEIKDNLLLSSEALAAQRGETSGASPRQSGGLDRAMGNWNYVFANHPWFASQASAGIYQYSLPLEPNSYVAMADIAELKGGDKRGLSQRERNKEDLALYLDNIFTPDQFRVLFATYGALCFDSPDELVTFVHKNRHWLQHVNRWQDEYLQPGPGQNAWEVSIKIRMREIFRQSRLFPPLMPEFQYPEKVQAARLPSTQNVTDWEQQSEIIEATYQDKPETKR